MKFLPTTAILVSAFAVCVVSCRDTGDYSPPVITILEPHNNFSLQVPDTLSVKGFVEDDRMIRSVTVALLNSDKVPVAPARYFSPDVQYFNFSASLVISDKSLKSGKYQLLVTAHDGINQRSRTVWVHLNETPRSLKGYFAVTSSVSFQSIVNRLNTSFEPDTTFAVPKAFGLSGVSGLWDQYYFVTDDPGIIYAYSIDKNELQWEYAANPPKPGFTGLWIDRQVVFSTLNGDAGIVNMNGEVILRTPAPAAKSIHCLAADDTYIYAEHVSFSGAITELTIFYRVTGLVRTQYLMKQDIISLIPYKNKVMVLSNLDGKGKINEFDPETMKLTELKTLDQVMIKSSLKINDQQFLILTRDNLLRYDATNNLISTYLENDFDFIRYDDMNDLLFLAKGNVLKVYDRIPVSLVYQKDFGENLLDFHIIYNKK